MLAYFKQRFPVSRNIFTDVHGLNFPFLGNYLESRSSAKFSTRDRDNDGESRTLADGYGPWWYKGGSMTWLLDDQRENYWGKAIGRKTSMMIRKVKR